MLIITRRQGQQIHVGNEIIVKVLENKGGIVKLGIACPNSVNVLRDEVMRKQMARPDQVPLMKILSRLAH